MSWATVNLERASIPDQLGMGRDGNAVRVVVQKTFIEVVESSPRERVRRVHSAPAAPVSLFPCHVECAEDFDAELHLAPARERAGTDHIAEDGPDAGSTEPKTTVVIRNLPEIFTRELFLQLLDENGFAGLYDFVYMPIEFGSGTTFGFAFVNLTRPEHAERFKKIFEGFSAWKADCRREATVGWSWSQGYDEHVSRYRNSPVMHETMPDECKPIILEHGVRTPFPAPTKKVPPLKRQRRRCGARGAVQAGASAGEESSSLVGACEPKASLPQMGIVDSPLLAGLHLVREERASDARRPRDRSPLRASNSSVESAGEGTRQTMTSKAVSASWADLSEGPLQAGLVWRCNNALSPAEPVPGCARYDSKEADLYSEYSTDVSSSNKLRSGSGLQESMSALSSDSSAVRSSRRGKRAGRRKQQASAEPWTGGSILLPGLTAAPALQAGTHAGDEFYA